MATPTGLSSGLSDLPEAGSTTSGYGASGPGAESLTKEQRTMDRVVQSAHQAVDRLAEKAGPAVEKVKSGYAEASAALHDRAGQLSDLQGELVEDARDKIRDHPLVAVGAALAIGLLIGRIVR